MLTKIEPLNIQLDIPECFTIGDIIAWHDVDYIITKRADDVVYVEIYPISKNREKSRCLYKSHQK